MNTLYKSLSGSFIIYIILILLPLYGNANDICGDGFLVDRGNIVKAVQSGNWSDAATWGGSLPEADDSVDIPFGIEVITDIDPPQLNSIFVVGTLSFDDTVSSIKLRQKWIAVGYGGLLEIGTEDTPYKNKVTLTFYGTDESENFMGEGLFAHGTKALVAMPDGDIEIHGASRNKVSWTKLNEHANPGDTSIQLIDSDTEWQEGDQIVLAASGWDPREAEVLTITEVEGATIHFTPALEFRHWGTIQNIPGETNDETFLLDQRAEVGLLSRNIVIQGAEDSYEGSRTGSNSGYDWSYDYGFGVHSMFMEGSFVRVEGAEFYRAGQTGHKGRYPFHWHLAGDVTGQYVKSCSVRNSFQRAYVVHGSNNAVIENNVAYNVLNHAYMTENGTETGNQFVRNLCVLTYTPIQEDFAFFNPQRAHGKTDQSEIRAANFWMVNGNNTVEENHAAGAFMGIGFFWDTQTVKAGIDTPILNFRNNVAHSCLRPKPNGRDLYGPMERGFGLMFRWMNNSEFDVIIENFTAYKCSNGGIWAEDEKIFSNCLLADNKFGIHTQTSLIEDSIIIGQTANDIGGSWPVYYGGVLLNLPGHNTFKSPTGHLRNITFVDVEPASLAIMGRVQSDINSIEGLQHIRSQAVDITHKGYDIRILDLDGTTTGLGPNSYIFSNNEVSLNDSSILTPEHNVQFSLPRGQMRVQIATKKHNDGSEIRRRDQTHYSIENSNGIIGRFGTKGSPDRHSAQGWVMPNQTYEIEFGGLTNHISLVATEGQGWIIMGIPFDTTSPAYVFREAIRHNVNLVRPHLLQPIASKQSRIDLESSDHTAYWIDPGKDVIYVKVFAADSVMLCDSSFLGDTTPYYTWHLQNFGSTELLDPALRAIWDYNADPDMDGVANGWEMATGTNPNDSASHVTLPTIDFTGLENNRFSVNYSFRNSVLGDLNDHSQDLIIEYSIDGEDWFRPRRSNTLVGQNADTSFYRADLSRVKHNGSDIFVRVRVGLIYSNLIDGKRRYTDYIESIRFSSSETHTFAQWQAFHDLQGFERDARSDSDNDGIETLVEFAFGGHPKRKDQRRKLLPRLSRDIENRRIGLVTRRASETIQYNMEYSTDLKTWYDASQMSDFSHQQTGEDDGLPLWNSEISVPDNETQIFLRMTIQE